MYKLVGIAAVAATMAVFAPGDAAAQAVNCPVKIGGILPLTGSMGPIAKKIAESARLAVEHVNAAGGVKGCPVEFILRDDQGQPTVGVDAAKYLTEVERVRALVASVSSGVTIPIASTVTPNAKVPQISCCSSAPVLTTMAQEGKTGGYFFRTFPTVKNLAYPPAMVAQERGLKRIAVIYVNTDYGTSFLKDFTKAVDKLGLQVVKSQPYAENQTSYRAEIQSLLAEKPDALFVVAFPTDGVTMTREWLSFGGTQNLILNNALRSPDFVKGVGAQYLQKAFGTDNASSGGPTVDAFRQSFQAAYNVSAEGPGIHNQYDAMMVLALAMNIAPNLEGASIRDAIRKTHTAGGTVVGTGAEEYRKALALIRDGKPIKYSGATGPIEFDQYGDVSGPAMVFTLKGETFSVDRNLSLDDMNALFKKIDG